MMYSNSTVKIAVANNDEYTIVINTTVGSIQQKFTLGVPFTGLTADSYNTKVSIQNSSNMKKLNRD